MHALRRQGPWLVCLLIGIGAAYRLRWTADDAYISYRYARNLVEGHGLVFNVGERVEGFTNLAWTLWVALGLALGAPAEGWSHAASLAAYAGVIALLARWPGAGAGEERGFPIAAAGAAACGALWSFASGGLETMAFALGVLGAVRVAARAGAAPRGGLLAGACAGLTSWLRPEGALLGLAFLLWIPFVGPVPRGRLRAGARVALGFGVCAAPPLLFRLAYYGALVPNTAFAKSAARAWYGQGLHYAGYFFQQYGVLLLGPVLWAWAMARPGTRARLAPGSGLALLVAGLLSAQIVRVGGDFMHGRLWVPVVPLLLLSLQASVRALWPPRAPGLAVAGLAIAAWLALFPAADPAAMWRSGIVDERTFPDPVRDRPGRAETFRHFFAGLDVRVAFTGGDARLMYEARVPLALESETGLTDAFIARQPLGARGRVGHEKHAPFAYLVDVRGAHFTLRKHGLEILQVARHVPLVAVQLGEERAYCLRWDPALMAALRARGARFVDFTRYLDRQIADLPRRDPAAVRAELDKLERFYFAHVQDPVRKQPFLDALADQERAVPEDLQ